MLNLLLLPFRLPAWIVVQLYRLCGLLLVQPLRFLFAVLGILSRRWLLAVVVVIYGGFALRVYSPYPVGEWYTTIVHYPDTAAIAFPTLFADTLSYRETDAPALRATQFRIAMCLLLAHALIVLTFNRHNRLRTSLTSKAARLRDMRPPALWPVSKQTEAQPLPAMEQPMSLPEEKATPKKAPPMVYARYGLLSRTHNDDLETIAKRLPPGLKHFIGMTED